MVSITVTRDLDKAVGKAINDGFDLKIAFKTISAQLRKSTKPRFELKAGGNYIPLSPVYRDYKKGLNPNAPILVGVNPDGTISGKLKRSLTKAGSPDHVSNYGKDFLIWGTKVTNKQGKNYAADLQKGNPDRNLPARPFMPLQPDTSRSNYNEESARAVDVINQEVSSQLKRIFK